VGALEHGTQLDRSKNGFVCGSYALLWDCLSLQLLPVWQLQSARLRLLMIWDNQRLVTIP